MPKTPTTGCWPGARGFRVDAEVVRDIALAASGLLNPSIGGESVYPPAPAFLFQPPVQLWSEDLGRGHRSRPLPPRSLHVPLPLRPLPDAPELSTRPTATSPAFAAPGRTRPLQALTLLNEPVALECARALALRTLRGRRSDRRRSAELRLPPLPGPPSRGRRDRTAHGVARTARPGGSPPGPPTRGTWPSTSPKKHFGYPPTRPPPSSPAGPSSHASC